MANDAAPSDPVSPASKPAADPDSLEHIVDDVPPAEPYVEWAVNELTVGRSAAAILKDLIAEGWSQEDAESITEQARLATRHLRGGVTRERVARTREQEYREALGKARTMGVLGGVGLIFGTAANALRSIFRSSALKTPKPKFVEEQPEEEVDAQTAAERLGKLSMPPPTTGDGSTQTSDSNEASDGNSEPAGNSAT